MTNPEFLKQFKEKVVKETYKNLLSNLWKEYRLSYNDFVEKDMSEIKERYTITGGLKHTSKNNHEIEYLQRCKDLFTSPIEELKLAKVTEAYELEKEYPGKQGYEFYKDAKKVLKSYEKNSVKKLNKDEKEIKDKAPLSEYLEKTEGVTKWLSEVGKIVLVSQASSEIIKKIGENQSIDVKRTALAIVAGASLAFGPKIVKAAVEKRKACTKEISRTLVNSVVGKINIYRTAEEEKYPYLKSDDSKDIKSKLLGHEYEKTRSYWLEPSKAYTITSTTTRLM